MEEEEEYWLTGALKGTGTLGENTSLGLDYFYHKCFLLFVVHFVI